MRKPETVNQPATTLQRLELQPPSLFQAAQHSPSITVENCTASLISVLADIILATCVSTEQNQAATQDCSDHR